jgi:hypothetical protein
MICCTATLQAKRQVASGEVPAVLCGSGQQHPFRAPQRVHRIAFEIVSSGVSISSRCRWASSCGSIMTLCRQPSQCSQARFPHQQSNLGSGSRQLRGLSW